MVFWAFGMGMAMPMSMRHVVLFVAGFECMEGRKGPGRLRVFNETSIDRQRDEKKMRIMKSTFILRSRQDMSVRSQHILICP